MQFYRLQGGYSIDLKIRQKIRPKCHFEKDTCMNYKNGPFFLVFLHEEFGSILGPIFGRFFLLNCHTGVPNSKSRLGF